MRNDGELDQDCGVRPAKWSTGSGRTIGGPTPRGGMRARWGGASPYRAIQRLDVLQYNMLCQPHNLKVSIGIIPSTAFSVDYTIFIFRRFF